MSVLPAAQIEKRLREVDDDFSITPILDWTRQISAGSIDLRLDTDFLVTTRSHFASLDPTRSQEIATRSWRYQRPVSVPYGQDFVLHPNELVLASSLEFLSFPNDLMAYVIGRSSWGRLGLIIATATHISPGFKGTLTLELVNAGNVPIHLYPGVRIAQLVLHEVHPKEKAAYGREDKYELQIGPRASSVHKDKELPYLRFPPCRSIVAVVGHKGSGKGIAARLLIEEFAYRYYSLSHVVRAEFEAAERRQPTREALRAFGDETRRAKGADYFVKTLLRSIQASGELTRESRIVIDGIRNRQEVQTLSRLPHFHLLAVQATKKRIIENLKANGFIVNAARRREDKKLGKETITMAEFDKAYARDKGGTDVYGHDIEKCIALAGANIIKNDTDIVDLQRRIRRQMAQVG